MPLAPALYKDYNFNAVVMFHDSCICLTAFLRLCLQLLFMGQSGMSVSRVYAVSHSNHDEIITVCLIPDLTGSMGFSVFFHQHVGCDVVCADAIWDCVTCNVGLICTFY